MDDVAQSIFQKQGGCSVVSENFFHAIAKKDAQPLTPKLVKLC